MAGYALFQSYPNRLEGPVEESIKVFQPIIYIDEDQFFPSSGPGISVRFNEFIVRRPD